MSQEPKPPGWSSVYGAAFGDLEVVRVYHLRPPYPDQTIAELVRLSSGGAVLDAGCGTGELGAARLSAGGEAANLRWVHGAVEDVPLERLYELVVAGDSVHWFDWTRVMDRFAALLGDHGLLAIVHREWHLDERTLELLRPAFARHSWNSDFAPLDSFDELERRGLFVRRGEHVSPATPWRPTLDDIVDVYFSTSGCARSRIADPEAFARELRAAVTSSLSDIGGRYDLDIVGTIVWGRPLVPTPS